MYDLIAWKAIFNSTLWIQAFFAMSGFLTAYSVLISSPNKPITPFKCLLSIVNRWVRYVPQFCFFFLKNSVWEEGWFYHSWYILETPIWTNLLYKCLVNLTGIMVRGIMVSITSQYEKILHFYFGICFIGQRYQVSLKTCTIQWTKLFLSP